MADIRQVKIVDLTGKTKTLTLPGLCTVDLLYEEVIKQGCAPGKQVAEVRLVYEGSELVRGQNKCLHDYDMPPMGASLFMVIRQVGGVDLRLQPINASLFMVIRQVGGVDLGLQPINANLFKVIRQVGGVDLGLQPMSVSLCRSSVKWEEPTSRFHQ